MLNARKLTKLLFPTAGLCAFLFFSCVTRAAEREAGEEIASASSDITLEIFQPDRFEEIPEGSTSATFKTSVPKSALYINGEYHGLTPLRATGLIPGRYAVQIKKSGYKTVKIAVQVKDGISDFYYIEMELEEPEKAEPLVSEKSLENEGSPENEESPKIGESPLNPLQEQSQSTPEP